MLHVFILAFYLVASLVAFGHIKADLVIPNDIVHDKRAAVSTQDECTLPLLLYANVTSTKGGSWFWDSVGSGTTSSDGSMSLYDSSSTTSSHLLTHSLWRSLDTSTIGEILTVDLGRLKMVHFISTQGNGYGNDEYVSEFQLKYSDDGKDWTTYKTSHGIPKIFQANQDSTNIVKTKFDSPIIARWIQIIPNRWSERIAMRMEIFGCQYVQDVLNFDGSSFLKLDLSARPIKSEEDVIRFRFKTNSQDGLLLYSQGSQGDILAVQLEENRLLVQIQLGYDPNSLTTISVGSLLDDNKFHDVSIQRYKQRINISVDQIGVKQKIIAGNFNKLDLDDGLYIGGMPYTLQFSQSEFDGELASPLKNFTGCIENLAAFQGTASNLFASYKAFQSLGVIDRKFRFEEVGQVNVGCAVNYFAVPVSFMDSEMSHVRLNGYEGLNVLNVSLEFRTFESDGLLFYHRFSSEGFVQLFMRSGRVMVWIVASNVPKIEIDNFDLTFNDGKWHHVTLIIKTDEALLKMDAIPMRTVRKISITTGSYYMIGGGVYSQKGFVGCMRSIFLDGKYKSPENWLGGQHYEVNPETNQATSLHIGSCHVEDKCNPNPCEHGATCRQSADNFKCDCEGSGYIGSFCHSSVSYRSCVHYKEVNPDSNYEEIEIDLDGSGPLPPVTVKCEFFTDGRNITYIGHANEETTKVDGYQEHGSFKQTIHYDTSMEVIDTLIDRSNYCLQKLGYDCKQSRILNSPTLNSHTFKPFAYWVSRQNMAMDYWAGSVEGSRKCECGLTGVCYDPSKWCNCDSGHNDWLWDGGEIKDTEYLPVRAVHFGDTGTPLDEKEGRYSLGPLECEGDKLFDDVITFRRRDAAIELGPSPLVMSLGEDGDIYFEFKTTSKRRMVIVDSVGSNGDFIRLTIFEGTHIQLEYASGKGVQVLIVESEQQLDDNKWHSVLMERNREEAMMVVDRAVIGKLPEPFGPVRNILLDAKLFIGSTSDDYQHGFVGCVRAMVINGHTVNLVDEVTKYSAGGKLYGVQVGCEGECSRHNPCMNGGLCLERYENYMCDCTETPFQGSICGEEIGVNLNPDYMVKYDFKGSYQSSLNEKIRIGFSTTSSDGFLLSAASDISQEYITLKVTEAGHLQLTLDFGFQSQKIVYRDQNFMTGRFHDIQVERFEQGRKLMMKVDHYLPQIYSFYDSLKFSTDAEFNNIRYIYIGRNESMQKGFSGCVARVQFNGVYPLRTLFHQDPLSNILAIPETLKPDFCGIQPITPPPPEVETRRPIQVESKGKSEMIYRQSTGTLMMVLIVALLFVLSIAIFIVIAKFLSRQKGAYLTREDEGARDAFDADTAVLQSRTGHIVEKKREWFI